MYAQLCRIRRLLKMFLHTSPGCILSPITLLVKPLAIVLVATYESWLRTQLCKGGFMIALLGLFLWEFFLLQLEVCWDSAFFLHYGDGYVVLFWWQDLQKVMRRRSPSYSPPRRRRSPSPRGRGGYNRAVDLPTSLLVRNIPRDCRYLQTDLCNMKNGAKIVLLTLSLVLPMLYRYLFC